MSRPVDKLTISRLMVLMAGLGLGLIGFGPRRQQFDALSLQSWRELATAMLIGVSLPGIWYTLGRGAPRRRLGVGGLLWLSLSLGVLLMTPPAIIEPLRHRNQLGTGAAGACLFYVLPLMSAWWLLAAGLAGQLRPRRLLDHAAWPDRFGVYLGLAWAVLGCWIMFDFYWEAITK